MRRLPPDSLAGWVIVVLIAGLVASQAVTLAVNYEMRSRAATVMGHFGLAATRRTTSAMRSARPKWPITVAARERIS